MRILDGLLPMVLVRLRDADKRTKAIYRSALGGLCALLSVAFATGFSSGEVFNGDIDANASSTTLTEVDMPFHPPQLPGKAEPDTNDARDQSPERSTNPAGPSDTEQSPEAQDQSPSTSRSTTTTHGSVGSQASKSSEEKPTPNSTTIDDGSQSEASRSDVSSADTSDDTSNEPTEPIEDTSSAGGTISGQTDEFGDNLGGDNRSTNDGSESDGSSESGDGSGTGSDEELVFNTCAEAYNAGVAPIAEDEPGYSLQLDRDRDGIACELDLDL